MSKKSIYHKGSMNKVTIIGGLKEVPSLHQFDDGVMTTISLATSYSSYDSISKTYSDKTEWHRVVLYEKLAEEIVRIGRAGMKFLIEGPLRKRDYVDKENNVCNVYEVIATELHPFSAIYKADEVTADTEVTLNA